MMRGVFSYYFGYEILLQVSVNMIAPTMIAPTMITPTMIAPTMIFPTMLCIHLV